MGTREGNKEQGTSISSRTRTFKQHQLSHSLRNFRIEGGNGVSHDLLDLGGRGRIVVGEDLEGDLVFLLRPPDLVVQLGVMEREAAVDRETLERVLVLLQ